MTTAEIWIVTCYLAFSMHDVSCDGIKEPSVIIQFNLIRRANYFGYYNFDETIVVSGTLTQKERILVILHEQTHYLNYKSGVLPLPTTDALMCSNEARAWEASNYYADLHGWEHERRWWELYSRFHCKEP